jgi:hypothetical protein
VKRLLALVVGALGLRALLRRRRERTLSPSAADLKATLAESRSAEAPSEAPAVDDPDVDARRADVHARARQAMDELG